ncbi:hypothetical protein C4649_21455 [Salmonella enterica subsp. enterica serovar Rubislaw]|nr:hypothetical protein C4649_21455 [Salmonella enterica subsp. enterica serovar Rubislaw]
MQPLILAAASVIWLKRLITDVRCSLMTAFEGRHSDKRTDARELKVIHLNIGYHCERLCKLYLSNYGKMYDF